MQHLTPEGEPGGAGALVEFLRREIGVDDRLHAAARRVGQRQTRAHAHGERRASVRKAASSSPSLSPK